MDKSFLNMDERFKGIEGEMKYDFNSSLWSDAEKMLNDTALDQAFVEAASASAFTGSVDFESLQDAFLDSAFTDASENSVSAYNSSFFNDFKNVESELHQSDSFVEAAGMSSVEYQTKYWEAADNALKSEGLHHEYRAEYWKVAEKMLLKNQRKFFFYKWGAVAIGLLLISFIGLNINDNRMSESPIVSNDTNVVDEPSVPKFNDGSLNEGSLKNNSTDNGGLLSKETSGLHASNINKNGGEDNFEPNSTKQNSTGEVDVKSLDLGSAVPVNEGLVINGDHNLTNHEDILKIKRNLTFYLKESPVNANLIDKKIDIRAKEKEQKNILSLKIGKGIGNSFGNSFGKMSPRNSVAISYVFTPSKRFKRFGFGLDAGVYHMNLANFEYERNYSVHHDFGNVEHYWYKMVYKDLIFFSTNFNTYLSVGEASKIKLGVGFDYLLTSRVGSEFSNSINEEVTLVQDSWGLSDVMNTSDVTIGLGYEYALNSKFSFLIDSKMGFKDKINNTYMKGERINKDLSIQLGIKYNIFTR